MVGGNGQDPSLDPSALLFLDGNSDRNRNHFTTSAIEESLTPFQRCCPGTVQSNAVLVAVLQQE